MNKILQATERGQITLPKKWRDKFATSYFIVEMNSDSMLIKPMKARGEGSLDLELKQAWDEYKAGNYITGEDLMKKYGL